MSQMHDDNSRIHGEGDKDDLERQLLEGITLTPASSVGATNFSRTSTQDDEDADVTHYPDNDVQGSLGLFAEAAQDMATAAVELGIGRHFACVDFCNQAAEKAAQAVSLLRFGRRSPYDHDLRALAALVGAPQDIQDEMAQLTPFHPEAFYADTPPEEADEVINAEQASYYVKCARKVLRWAKTLVLAM